MKFAISILHIKETYPRSNSKSLLQEAMRNFVYEQQQNSFCTNGEAIPINNQIIER